MNKSQKKLLKMFLYLFYFSHSLVFLCDFYSWHWQYWVIILPTTALGIWSNDYWYDN